MVLTSSFALKTSSGVSTTIKEIITVAISAGVSGVVSVFVLGYIKRYIDKKLDEADAEKKQREEYQHRRNVANAKLHRAEGRLFFWLHRAVVKPPPNGELEESWANYNKAEEVVKAIDLEIVADYEMNG